MYGTGGIILQRQLPLLNKNLSADRFPEIDYLGSESEQQRILQLQISMDILLCRRFPSRGLHSLIRKCLSGTAKCVWRQTTFRSPATGLQTYHHG